MEECEEADYLSHMILKIASVFGWTFGTLGLHAVLELSGMRTLPFSRNEVLVL